MSAALYTPDEEERYRLPPLPEIEPITADQAAIRNRDYEAARARYRLLHPVVTLDEIARGGG